VSAPPSAPHPGAVLRELVTRPQGLLSAAIWDCMTARLLEDAGFEALFVSGAAVSASRLGMPDFAFMGLSDMADQLRNITRSLTIPALVDADTGYGNALNAIHASEVYAGAGAAGMLLEDQVFPKRCGQLAGKAVIALEEYMVKLVAVLRERPSPDFLICARTDAAGPEGIDEAIERGKRFHDAGADIIFVEAAQTLHDVERVAVEVPGVKMYNLSTGGVGPKLDVAQLRALGFAWIVFPALAMGAVTHAVATMAREVLASGSDAAIVPTGFSPAGLAELVGAERWDALGASYGEAEQQQARERGAPAASGHQL
jgi:methylisocitrate lyase